jgi:hypothetical protein
MSAADLLSTPCPPPIYYQPHVRRRPAASAGLDFPIVDEFEVDLAVARTVIHVLDLESLRVE